MVIATPVATTDIPTVNGSVIMIISRPGFRPGAGYREAQYGLDYHRGDQNRPIRRRWSRPFFVRWEFDMAAPAQIRFADCAQIIQFGHS